MTTVGTLKIEKATPTVGAKVLDLDVERMLNDDELPQAIMEACEEYGALVFPQLNLDDETQAKFFSRLGEVVKFPEYTVPEVMVISLDPDNPNAEYFKGNILWHIDGTINQAKPSKATIMTAHRISPTGGETEFVSTYAAYDALSEEQKQQFESLQVFHSMEAVQRGVTPDPTAEQLANWKERGGTASSLVWTHESGRKSLVMGATADYIVGMEKDEGRKLLGELLERATQPDRVFSHTWTVGDTVMWDNTGTLHRAMPYDPASRREMHRTTILGTEEIK